MLTKTHSSVDDNCLNGANAENSLWTGHALTLVKVYIQKDNSCATNLQLCLLHLSKLALYIIALCMTFNNYVFVKMIKFQYWAIILRMRKHSLQSKACEGGYGGLKGGF